MFETLLFWIFATVSTLAAFGVILAPSILYSALCLIIVFFSISAFFIMNNADFLGTAQLLVYGVGLTVVILFGIMFTGDGPLAERAGKTKRAIVASLSVVSVAAILFLAVKGFHVQGMEASPEWIRTLQTVGTTGAIGKLIFSKYVLPFEVASLLLLGAMIGAILLSKKTFTPDDPGLTFSLKDGRLAPSLVAEWRKDVGFEDTTTHENDTQEEAHS
jgi:NADH-quinone oxidoreductase subunit J